MNDNFGAHSGNNMLALVASRGGGGFTQRGPVDGQKSHPTSVLVSAMRAVGVQGPLGEIADGTPALA